MHAGQGGAPLPADRGATVVEVVMMMALVAALAGLSAPLSATVVDAGRARHAAGFLAARFRMAQVEAVNRGANTGVVFDFVAGRWRVRICRDGTGNGLRRAEIASGADPCLDGPHEIGAMFADVDIDVDPRLIGPGGEPGNPDPVRLGTGDVASFTALGTATPGSVFVRSRRGEQYVVRVAGATGRIRVLRWNRGTAMWIVP